MKNASEHRGGCPALSGKIPMEIVFLSMWLLGITDKATAEYFVYWKGKKTAIGPPSPDKYVWITWQCTVEHKQERTVAHTYSACDTKLLQQ